MPERFRTAAIAVPSWQCLGDEGWTIYDTQILKRHTPNPGAHGFDPELPSMAALFVAHGPDLRLARVAGIDNIDVYRCWPAAAHPPEANDGDPASTLPLMRQGRDFRPAQY